MPRAGASDRFPDESMHAIPADSRVSKGLEGGGGPTVVWETSLLPLAGATPPLSVVSPPGKALALQQDM
jgi:hypothetical protein